MRRAFLALTVLVAAHSARADEITGADGTTWQLVGDTLTWGTLQATFAPHYLGIDCATGLAAQPTVAPPYLPPGWIAHESVDGARTSLVACTDLPKGGVLVVTVVRGAALTPVEASAVRGLLLQLAEIGASYSASMTADDREQIIPFEPPAKPVVLSHESGAWGAGKFDEHSIAFFLRWPDVTAGIKLTRTPKSQSCSEIGARYGERPAWAPPAFSSYGASKDTWSTGCLDAADRHAIIVEVDSRIAPAAQLPRVTALLDAIVTAVGTAPSPAPSPTVTDTPASSYTPSYTPSYSGSSSDDEPHVALTQRLHGLSIALHRLAPSGDAIDTSYGMSLGYARTLRYAGRLRPRVVVRGGYDEGAEWIADLRLEIGAHVGDEGVRAELFGAVGADGVGLGSDPAIDRVYVGFDAYYGVGVRLGIESLDVGFAYFARNADTVDASKRFELGYRLHRGQRLGLDITSYDGAGTFIAGSLTL